MQDTLLSSFGSDPMQSTLGLVLVFIAYVVAGVLPASAALYLLYYLLTLPMRRNERARMLLDVLELGLGQGRSPEAALLGVAASGDRAFGKRFYALVKQLQGGKRLADGLEKVPRLLPPQVTAMLRVGERIGDVRKVLPACRQVVRDGISQVRSALNYVIVVVFVATPPLVLVPIIFNVSVLPKYREVLSPMSSAQLPPLSQMMLSGYPVFTAIQIATILFIWAVVLAYVGGPRLGRWMNRIVPGLPARLALCLPWRRRRVQRDFSSVLALLLDSGVPEPEAVGLAAQATGNEAIVRRAAAVTRALREGTGLPDALKAIDAAGELRWRISNATHGYGGFARALAGWHASLDAKAFQLEQSAAQVLTTVLVLVNGVIVGGFVIGIFMALTRLINGAVLW